MKSHPSRLGLGAQLIFIVMLGLTASSASAVTQIGNLNTATANSQTISATAYRAQPFRTAGATTAFRYIGVRLNMAAPLNNSGRFFLALYSGENRPVAMLPHGLLNGPSFPASGLNDFFANDKLILYPGTTYWLVAGVTDGPGQYRWNTAANADYQTTRWAQDNRTAASAGKSTAWIETATSNPFKFRVEALERDLVSALAKYQFNGQRSSAGALLSTVFPPYLMVFTLDTDYTRILTFPTGAAAVIEGPEAVYYFHTKAALDGSFPAGKYQLSVPGSYTFNYDFSQELFPVAPQVTNGVWNNGVLMVDATKETVIAVNAFTGFGTSGTASKFQLKVFGLTAEEEVADEGANVSLDGQAVRMTAPSGLTIPAGRLTNGRMYFGEFSYMTLTSLDRPSFPPNSAASGLFVNATGFYIAAQAAGTTAQPPVITSQPLSRQGTVGGSVTFSIAATVNGSPQLGNTHFEWTHNGIDIDQGGPKHVFSADRTSMTIFDITESDAGTYAVELANAGGVVVSNSAVLTVRAVTTPPQNQSAAPGQSITLSANPGATDAATRWFRNGVEIAGATSTSLALANLGPAHAGIYSLNVSVMGSSASSQGAIVGVSSQQKTVLGSTEFPNNIHPATGFVYDQILLKGPAETVRADPGQILRISYVDLDDDIVQVEFSGPGSLTINLESASGPAEPIKYNQTVGYMKGHASIVVTGATENTNLSIFSVGTLVNGNPSLYRPGMAYDGFADVAFVAISSSNGKFGSLRSGNASYFATEGIAGIYAPGVQFTGVLFIGDISAANTATPSLYVGQATDVRVTGGDLLQNNGKRVQIQGFNRLVFADGISSHGILLPAQPISGRLDLDGRDVTDQVAVKLAP